VPIASTIASAVGDTPLLVMIAAAVFGGVFLLSVAFSRMLSARSAIKRRALEDFALADMLGGSRDAWDRRSVRHKALVDATRVVVAAATKLGPTDRESQLDARMEMVKAGFFDAAAMYWYYAARVFGALVLPVIFLFSIQLLPYSFSATRIMLGVAFFALAGYALPGFYIRRRQMRLKEQVRHGFPDFLDLLLVCVEAGVSPPAAIDRVGRELAINHPHLGANLHLVSLELRAGQALTAAMKNLADRVGVEEIFSLAALLRQSEELGTSLGDALRVYSLEMREKRMSRAEEKAHALPVKLVLPLVLCIFPVVITVVMLPLIIRFRGVFF
jgi:tight adherence protein C